MRIIGQSIDCGGNINWLFVVVVVSISRSKEEIAILCLQVQLYISPPVTNVFVAVMRFVSALRRIVVVVDVVVDKCN